MKTLLRFLFGLRRRNRRIALPKPKDDPRNWQAAFERMYRLQHDEYGRDRS